MTKIDFYQIENGEAPLLFSCRLIAKIYRMGHQVHIHAESDAQAEEIDNLLWSFRPESFIPHMLDNVAEIAPVRIGCSNMNEPSTHQEVLVNLSGAVPDFFSRFERVAEVVPLDENSRDAARENFRFYKDRGYEIKYNKVGKRTAGSNA
ncbi:MAG: DNA polymerase-3 subunit chi [Candidatus Azotimanducaceae bacterium]|jgi:DNA polymerase-3 subunit chi